MIMTSVVNAMSSYKVLMNMNLSLLKILKSLTYKDKETSNKNNNLKNNKKISNKNKKKDTKNNYQNQFYNKELKLNKLNNSNKKLKLTVIYPTN